MSDLEQLFKWLKDADATMTEQAAVIARLRKQNALLTEKLKAREAAGMLAPMTLADRVQIKEHEKFAESLPIG